MNSKEQVIQWLGEHQLDLIKIVGKHTKPNHKLSVEEIVSELNNYCINKVDNLLKNHPEIKDEKVFKRFLYKMARNFISWTRGGSHSLKYAKYTKFKVDYTIIDDEDGEKTAFEHICDTVGEQDPEFIKLNKSEKYENILKWLIDYSDALTSRQKNLLPFVLQGKNLDDLAKALKVTHQAISHSILDMNERIKSHIKININEDCDKTVLIEGNKSINYLFGEERKKSRSKKV
jgi:predicted small metal-binding protein